MSSQNTEKLIALAQQKEHLRMINQKLFDAANRGDTKAIEQSIDDGANIHLLSNTELHVYTQRN